MVGLLPARRLFGLLHFLLHGSMLHGELLLRSVRIHLMRLLPWLAAGARAPCAVGSVPLVLRVLNRARLLL